MWCISKTTTCVTVWLIGTHSFGFVAGGFKRVLQSTGISHSSANGIPDFSCHAVADAKLQSGKLPLQHALACLFQKLCLPVCIYSHHNHYILHLQRCYKNQNVCIHNHICLYILIYMFIYIVVTCCYLITNFILKCNKISWVIHAYWQRTYI